MNENEEIKEQEQTVDTATTNENETHEQEQTKTQETINEEEIAKTFTQEQVNEFVRKRLDKERKTLFSRYGCESREALDDLIGKAQSYEIMNERYEKLKGDYAKINEEIAFLENNVNPERIDDIRAIFKGKGIDFTREALKQEIATHPEWLNAVEKSAYPKTTLKVSADRGQVVKSNERDEVAKLFGLDKLI